MGSNNGGNNESVSTLTDYIGLIAGGGAAIFLVLLPFVIVYFFYAKDKFKKTLSKVYSDFELINEYFDIYEKNYEQYLILKEKPIVQSNDYFSFYDVLHNLDISLTALKEKSEYVIDDVNYLKSSSLNKSDLSTLNLEKLNINYDKILADVRSDKVKLYERFNNDVNVI
jgi:hypothetical protein